MAPTGNSTNDNSIAKALAGMTESVDIPKPRDFYDPSIWDGKDTFATVTARSAPIKKQTRGLPTPPNSISPSLPPQTYKHHGSAGPPTPPTGPTHIDSEIDLDAEVEHANAQGFPQRGLTASRLGKLADSDAVGTINSSLLAKRHLPGILLENGPLAIRHVMNHLSTDVPGFLGIPPAKARRIVVAALESRTSDRRQGGTKGDVIFEKVGWGKWDARKRGQISRHLRESQPPSHSPPNHDGIRIPGYSTQHERSQDTRLGSHESREDDDTLMEDIEMPEHEADKMSLDNDSCDSYDPPKHKRKHSEDSLDATDEEDWEAIGADALRNASLPHTGGLKPAYRPYQLYIDPKSRGRGQITNPSSRLINSVPSHSLLYNQLQQEQRSAAHNLSDAEDREAVEALLKLSSV